MRIAQSNTKTVQFCSEAFAQMCLAST